MKSVNRSGLPLLLGIALLLSAWARPAAADAPAAPVAESRQTRCIEVHVEGNAAGTFDCLSNELQAAALRGRSKAAMSAAMAAPNPVDGPPSYLNLYNQTATRQRLGTAFGNGVVPQRPAVNYGPSLPVPHK